LFFGVDGTSSPLQQAGTNGAGSLLVVEDNEINRTALCRLLERKGFAVTVAQDGRQALELLRGGRFDLVLLDVMMAGVNGLDVLQALRAQHAAAEMPVIMTTAQDQSEDIVRALNLGATDYVIKPLDFPVLLARIRTQLSLKRAVERVRRLEGNLAQRNAELEAVNTRLTAANGLMKLDLEAAARVQEAFLPQESPRFPGVRFAWLFKPCEQLAGDMLNVFALDESHVALYVLDVSGHGVAAALLSVTLNRLLSPFPPRSSLLVQPLEGSPGRRLVPPREIAGHLNQRFPWHPATEQFFTLLYGILSLDTGELRYISAGHPGPVHVPRGAGAAFLPEMPGLPIGVGEAGYREHSVLLQPGDRLYVFSDGLIEATNPDRQPFGKNQLQDALEGARSVPLQDGLSRIWDELERWCGDSRVRDDVSILALELTASPPGMTG
jgi:sigma-B regulation protein RsbU (phosphoserine phosphatase)